MGILGLYGPGSAGLYGSDVTFVMKVGIGVAGEWKFPWVSKLIREVWHAQTTQQSGKMVGRKEAYLYISGSTGLMKVG